MSGTDYRLADARYEMVQCEADIYTDKHCYQRATFMVIGSNDRHLVHGCDIDIIPLYKIVTRYDNDGNRQATR